MPIESDKSAAPNGSLTRRLLYVLLAVVPVAAALAVGQVATFPNLAPWYASLAKPAFNPPNWLFGPVWTTLFVLMVYSVWRALRLPPSRMRRWGLILFYVQLALNAAWPWMFFAAHSPALGLVDIVPQWIAIAGTIVIFRKLDGIAAWCLVPLAAWVAFAALLNVSIWRLNS
jgi:tryptophan-rich sensory protein